MVNHYTGQIFLKSEASPLFLLLLPSYVPKILHHMSPPPHIIASKLFEMKIQKILVNYLIEETSKRFNCLCRSLEF